MTDLTEYTVRAVNIALLCFCGIEAIIVLLNFPRNSLRSRASRIFFAEMLAIAFTIICYTASLIIDSNLTSFASEVFMGMAYVGLYGIIFMYILYIKAQIDEIERDRPVPMLFLYAALMVCIIGAFLDIHVFFESDTGPFKHGMGVMDTGFIIGNAGEVVLTLMTLILLIRYRRSLSTRQTVVLSFMPLLILIAVILEPFAHGIELHYPAISIAFVIVYTQHHMDLDTRYQLEEAENMRNRISMATGRIKPHYLYNVLTSIYYLCDTDPQKAQYAIGIFSEYMRNTLEAMERGGLVPFTWELNEIKNYLTLEKLRFGDRIKVVYDIEYEDFMLPPLSIQPLVENAVKHGLSPREEGGTVKLSTRKLSKGWAQIVVMDDGVGFNIGALKAQDITREGVVNVKERIKLEVDGDLNITSSPGRGTVATVTIKAQDRKPIGRHKYKVKI